MISTLRQKIQTKRAKIGIIGLGYVGLPLGVNFAKAGFFVLGIDTDTDRINKIKNKIPYILDVPAEDIMNVVRLKKFSPTTNFKRLKELDVIIICVPTPLKRKIQPDISYIMDAVRQISKNLRKGQLVILESTTYPGTTKEVILPMLEKEGFKHGRDFFLCFSPERLDPGNKNYPVNKIPKVIGGITKESAALAKLLYKNIINKVVVVSSAHVAEAVKLLENTFRLINIGLIDELAMMCHKMDIDIWEVIEAAKTKPFGFMPFYPGPGVGGHCIGTDPLYLYWKARRFGFKSHFIKLASDIINFMPCYVVERINKILTTGGIKLNKAKILILGVTYKKDVKDLRESPAVRVIDLLQKNDARVLYHDPYIPYLKINHINLKSVSLAKNLLKKTDCVVVITDHNNLDYNLIAKNSKLIFDTRNAFKNIKNIKGKVVRL